MSNKSKMKTKKFKSKAIEEAPKELTPKERTKQAIGLCYGLLANAPIPYTQHEQVVKALQFLESLFNTVETSDVSAEVSKVETLATNEKIIQQAVESGAEVTLV